MSYCGPIGLPHSQFLGWSEEDQDKALAWYLHSNSKCSDCGTNPRDWVDPETGRAVEPPPYSVVVERCWGCQALEDLRESTPSAKEPGRHLRFVPYQGGD